MDVNTGAQIGADTIIAICAVFVSLVATFLAAWSMRTQQKHNRISVKPVAVISLDDYRDKVAVRIFNSGLGPLKINKLSFVNDSGVEKHHIQDHLEKYLPNDRCEFFLVNYKNLSTVSVLPAGNAVEFFSLIGDPNQSEFVEERDKVRNVLKGMSVTLVYEDFYGQVMPKVTRSFDWFGRHVAETSAPSLNEPS